MVFLLSLVGPRNSFFPWRETRFWRHLKGCKEKVIRCRKRSSYQSCGAVNSHIHLELLSPSPGSV
ncbi:hypothetical protein NC652_027961 [Populus alba x Populus x berolinensis]|uniref:Uncharacterized protein n=1 Tax=Populus alba x Populus x berolinensis TaxID=444605 RepID=A0AAD6M6B9_9ROSI|nr:hypothetical protein NC652_027961 [Populus alba x Populus x berolinensis]KAJ6979651.1 hypothetical protein NC653_027716 [Populus alba x Populus x berolinensis]